MVFYILNRQEELLTILSNEESENSILYKAVIREQLDKMYTLDIELSAVSPESQYVVEENYVLFKDLMDDWQLYIIRQVTESHGVDHSKSVYCENASQELIDDLCTQEIKGSTITPAAVLSSVLLNTRWEVGNVSTVAAHSLTTGTKNKSVLEVIQRVRSEFSLHIRFRYAVVGNKIAHRYVDLMTSIGNDFGKRFEYSKDIEAIDRIVDTTDIKTAIVPVGGIPEGGKVPIDITSLALADLPVIKPAGQNYIEDTGATALWGYGTSVKRPRFIYYENTETIDKMALLNEAWEVLKALTVPKITYTLKVIDLYAMSRDSDMSFESIKTGDLAVVVDTEFTPVLAVKTTIIEKVVDLLSPENNEVTLGNYIESLATNSTSSVIDTVNKRLDVFNPTIREFGNGSYSEIIKVNDQALKEAVGYTYIKDTEGVWVYDSPSNLTPTKMIALKGGKLGIGKWNPSTSEWQITTFIDGDSVNASAINTGSLNAKAVPITTLGYTYALKWSGAITSGTSFSIVHNLGYFPIVSLGCMATSVPTGNQVLKYQYLDLNTVVVSNFSSTGLAINAECYLW